MDLRWVVKAQNSFFTAKHTIRNTLGAMFSVCNALDARFSVCVIRYVVQRGIVTRYVYGVTRYAVWHKGS